MNFAEEIYRLERSVFAYHLAHSQRYQFKRFPVWDVSGTNTVLPSCIEITFPLSGKWLRRYFGVGEVMGGENVFPMR